MGQLTGKSGAHHVIEYYMIDSSCLTMIALWCVLPCGLTRTRSSFNNNY